MKLDQLKYFVHVAQSEHINRSAKALHISPSAVSHAISQLEETFGQALFEKIGRNIALTEFGRQCLDQSLYLLGEAEKMKQTLSAHKQQCSGHYRLAATHMYVDHFLVPAWLRISQEYCELTADILSYRSAEVVYRIFEGELDLGFCLNPVQTDQLNTEIICHSEFHPVVRKKHPITQLSQEAQIEALSDYPAAIGRSFQHIESCEHHQGLAQYGIIPKRKLFFDSNAVALASVKNSDLWALFPDHFYQQYPDHLVQIRLPDQQAIPLIYTAVWSANKPLPSILKHLINEVKTQFCREQ